MQKRNSLIAKHLLDYCKMLTAEAEKMEMLGVIDSGLVYEHIEEIRLLADTILLDLPYPEYPPNLTNHKSQN